MRVCITNLTQSNVFKLSKNIIKSKQWVDDLSLKCIPLKEFQLRYDRSNGPGGQNVNKVNTKCTLTLEDFSKQSWIPKEIRMKMTEESVSRYYKRASDAIVIQAQESRSREQNKNRCFTKFLKDVKDSCKFGSETSKKKLHKWARITVEKDTQRLKQKKFRSDKLKRRKVSFPDY